MEEGLTVPRAMATGRVHTKAKAVAKGLQECRKAAEPAELREDVREVMMPTLKNTYRHVGITARHFQINKTRSHRYKKRQELQCRRKLDPSIYMIT